jgi:hypothetical protein
MFVNRFISTLNELQDSPSGDSDCVISFSNSSIVTEIIIPVEIFICLTFLPWNGDSYKDVDDDCYDGILYAATDYAFIYIQ